jgi:N-methylhydantoinase A
VRSSLSRLDRLDWTKVGKLFDEMEEEGRAALIEAGARKADIAFAYSADMRYLGQQFELIVELEHRPASDADTGTARRRFEEQYLQMYKLIQAEVPVEVLNWRITASAPAMAMPDLDAHEAGKAAKAASKRRVHLWQDNQEVAVMPRSALRAGNSLDGPVILEEKETTLVIPPGWQVALGDMGCVVATWATRATGTGGK